MVNTVKIIDDFSIYIDEIIKAKNQIISKIVEDYCGLQLQESKKQEKHIINLINDIEGIVQDTEKQNYLTSLNFNIFNFFGVNETMHSKLLAHLLNPYSDHGQKHLFINAFLDLLGVKRFSEDENWIVTAEKGRIDLLLKRNNPHSVVVIENKSNYANDQGNQLYRYWYQEIYSSIINRHLPIDYILNPPEEFYQLIYLSPDHGKIPSNNSLLKPLDWKSDLPDEVPIKIKQVIFSELIVDWLNISLKSVSSQNTRIKEHIKQYLEYWNN